MKKILLFAPVCLFIFNIAHASDDHLVISQVQIAGANTTDDFIEIYNPTAADINLGDFRLVKRTKTATSDTSIKSWSSSDVIKAHSFYLWASSSFTAIGLTPDATTAVNIANNNGIAIRNGPEDTGTIIDSVAWGEATNAFIEGSVFPTNPPANQALLRSADTNNNAADFSIVVANPRNLASSSGATPPADPPVEPEPDSGSASGPPPPAYSLDILISEIFPNPDGKDTGEEWIELYNSSASDVDLSGWSIDDEGSEIGNDAFVFPEGSLIAGNSFLVITLVEENFSLNNTGGDAVRLFWPDQTLASQVSYTETAKDDESFARNSGNFVWTSLVSKGAANQFPQPEATGITSPAQTKIKINEIFPNPKGTDSGAEWIEVLNSGTEPVYLHGWYVDDGEKESKLGSSAWRIQSPTVSPGGVALLMIPAGKASLNNTGTETVRLFNENKVLIDFVIYEDSKEDMSFAFIDGKWTWSKPTPNAINTVDTEEKTAAVNIVINEIYPEPERGSKQEEFIELFNPSDAEIDLTGFKLADESGTSHKLSGTIGPLEYLVIKKSDSGISLNNSGNEKVILSDTAGEVIASLDYEDAPKDQSYNLTSDGTYVWSTNLTPGKENVIADGRVSGATLLPRTGGGGFSMWDGFVLWAIIWYIYVRLSKKGTVTNEQTRID